MNNSQTEIEDRVYSFDQLLATGFDVDSYSWCDLDEGSYRVRLDSKSWGKGKLNHAVVICFTVLETSCKQRATVFRNNGNDGKTWFGLRDIPVGSILQLATKISSQTKRPYIADIERITS